MTHSREGLWGPLTCDEVAPHTSGSEAVMGCDLLGVGIGLLLTCPQPVWSSSRCRWSCGMWSSGVEISKSSSVRCSPSRARDLSPLGLHDSSPAPKCTSNHGLQHNVGGNHRLLSCSSLAAGSAEQSAIGLRTSGMSMADRDAAMCQ